MQGTRWAWAVLALLALAACSLRGPASANATPAARIRYLGVSGFLIERGDDAVLTAPLFTRPSWLEVTTGTIASNQALVESSLPTSMLTNVRAVVSGHAHYDHLLDVPNVLARAPQAKFFTNRSARNILVGAAPDRPAKCAGAPPPVRPVPRYRVTALDDPNRSAVDYTYCPSRRPATAPVFGSWAIVPGTSVRVMAFCSEHPDHLGPLHFAPGGVETEACVLPNRAAEWLEGTTLSFLIDFLDLRTGSPAFRVYYQDAPTNAPAGLVPETILQERPIDVALLCVGAYEQTADAPTRTIRALWPRYVLGGHWEDFGRPSNQPPTALPLLDLATWVRRTQFLLPPTPEIRPMRQNGATMTERFAVPRQGDAFDFAF